MTADLVKLADAFAEKAHERQKRKYTGEPYIEHPRAVSRLVASVPHDDAMLAAALLHDTVEDCGVRLTDIVTTFGIDVGTLVEQLTDVSKPTDGNRAVRKALDRHRTDLACPRAKTIKLADLIDNSRSIVVHDPKFAEVYLAEKRLLLPFLKPGDPTLWEMAARFVEAGAGES